MTKQDISKALIGYYNIDVASAEIAVTMTVKWICENIEEKDRARVLQTVFENFTPTAANPFPKIAEFKAAFCPDGTIEREAVEAYAMLERKSFVYRPVVIEDPAISAGLEAIGGWIEFCNRSTDENPWKRKEFCKAFIAARESGYSSSVKIYRGIADEAKPILIGDEKKCQLAFDENLRPAYLENKSFLKLAEKAS